MPLTLTLTLTLILTLILTLTLFSLQAMDTLVQVDQIM
jgi:hypothetical protein